MEVSAKVLEYEILYHGIYGGKAKVKILNGPDKGEVITVQTAEHYKKGDKITLYRDED